MTSKATGVLCSARCVLALLLCGFFLLLVSCSKSSGDGSSGGASPGAKSNSSSGAGSIPLTPSGKIVALGSKGLYRFTIELDPSPPVLSDYFSVWTRVEQVEKVEQVGGGASKPTGVLSLDATMPEHRHGMTTLPKTRMHEDGRFRTTGCRFHMHGRWVFALRFEAKGGSDAATIEFPFHPAPLKR